MPPKKKDAKAKVTLHSPKFCLAVQQLLQSLTTAPVQAVGKDKKKDAKKDTTAAGDVEAASIEELHQKIQTLEKEKNKEEEYRNYMQLERVSCPHAMPAPDTAVRPFNQHMNMSMCAIGLACRTKSMPSGRSPRRSWKTRRQKCATRTGRLRRQRTCTSESSRSVRPSEE
jgi:hypothetical protein